jgi:transcriptional antiterminator NusG
LTDEEVKKMGVETGKKTVSYQVGDHVRILSGSLVGSAGVVHSIDLENNIVTVSANMFGRDTNIEIGLDQVALFE